MCPTVDEIFQRLRVDALNYNPNFSISKGTESYIRFSCIASIIGVPTSTWNGLLTKFFRRQCRRKVLKSSLHPRELPQTD